MPPPPPFFFLFFFFFCAKNIQPQIQITFTTSEYNGYHISCFGAKDGSITANVSGGTPPYTYQWSNEQTTATITGLSADFYNLVVTDSAGESAEYGVNLTGPEYLKPILTEYQYNNGYNISLYGASNGSITTAIDGGVSPFTFQWEDGPTTQNRTQLGGGFYVLQVIDANNCASVVQSSLSEPERDDWTMGGNANTNPANNFIGTTDNKDLVLKTNAVERLRLKSSGVIDVLGNMKFDSLAGDTMPKSLFIGTDGSLYRSGQGGGIRSACNMVADWYVGQDVVRDVVLCDPGQQVGINGCTAPLEAFQIGDVWTFHSGTGVHDNKSISFNSHWDAGSSKKLLLGYSSRIVFNNQTDNYGGSIDLQVDGTQGNSGDAITWKQGIHLDKNGRVTLGDYTAASEQLEIVHDKADGGIALNRVNGTNAGKSEIKFMHNNTSHWAIGSNLGNNADQNFFIWSHDANGGSGAARFFIDDAGRVGINTTPPTTGNSLYKLFVADGIATRDVKVQATGWPDYVLKKDFALMTIDELDDFISENEHLPGFPSSKEIEENEGYEAGDMIQRQQKQIEQQALYIIELQKQMNELRKEVKQLKK